MVISKKKQENRIDVRKSLTWHILASEAKERIR